MIYSFVLFNDVEVLCECSDKFHSRLTCLLKSVVVEVFYFNFTLKVSNRGKLINKIFKFCTLLLVLL